jgi:hypothetical protein
MLSACGSPGEVTNDGGGDARKDAADGATALADGALALDASDGADETPPFTLGLSPPAVDCAPYAGQPACVLHVAAGTGAPGATGLTWQTALSDVQDALDRATCGCDVWIAGGTYLPTRALDAPGAAADPRNRSFVLWPRANVLGGFAGDEADAAARRPGHETVLSGDLGVTGTTDDNAYHVVVGADGAALDGLTLRGGEANGLEGGQGVGAGLFMFGATMTLRNVTLSDNDADSGAGVYADGRSRPHLVGCTLARNTANDGGGLVALGDVATVESSLFEDDVGTFSGPAITDLANTLTVTDSQFLRNRGDSGGALTVSGGVATFERCWFEGNHADSFGGAMLVRFGAAARLSSTVLVANGSAGFAGAVALWTGSLDLEGATIVDNYGAFAGGAFLIKDGAHFGLGDSVVWRNADDQGKSFDLEGDGNTIVVTTCDVPPEVAATASFDADAHLGNVPLATRFAVQDGDVGEVPVAGAATVFTAGDRIELGDDGVERRITSVVGDDISFAPPLALAAPRFLRVDLWSPDAPSLDLDLTPRPGSPLVDAASAGAPALDVHGHARVGAPDIGALELGP